MLTGLPMITRLWAVCNKFEISYSSQTGLLQVTCPSLHIFVSPFLCMDVEYSTDGLSYLNPMAQLACISNIQKYQS